ncbi:MAG TPA: hypothetical protein VGM37_21515 [Armatimonadota bacterium]|jgi:hypothetical protein
MNFIAQRSAFAARFPSAGRRIRCIALAIGVISSAGLRPASAATVTVDLDSLSAVSAITTDDWLPTVVDNPNGGRMISYFNAADWMEFPFTIPAGQGGVYTASAQYGTPNPVAPDSGLPVTISLDIRKAGSEVHVASQDIILQPTGADESAYNPSATFSVSGFDLAPGDYILRLRNVSLLHTTAGNRSGGYQYRAELGYAAANRSVNITPITFTSTGALPATGTISGKVTASDLGYGVAGAMVMAMPTGKEIAEPSPFWYVGYWTLTDANGNYSLTTPAGAAFTVQAARPDSYALAGAQAADISVASGATATANLSLKSNWSAVDGSGSLRVQSEYFFAKIPDPLPDITLNSGLKSPTNMDIQCDSNADNNYKISWTGSSGNPDQSDYADVYVDVPTGQAGAYDLTKDYTCGTSGGTIDFIANPGDADESTVEAVCDNSGGDPNDPGKGYYTRAQVLFPTTINLHAGRNVIREKIVGGGGVDFDAFVLQKHADIPTGPGVANPKDANFVYVIGEQGSGTVGYPQRLGNTVTNLTRGSYIEIPMTFDSPGIYRASISTATPLAGGAAVPCPSPSVQLDLRPASSNAHYATDDIAIPSSGSAFVSTTVADIPVLQSGDYILRMVDTTLFHTTVANRANFNAYGSGGFISNRVDVGQAVFTKTGDLPATATLSGVVTGSDIGGGGVADAEVMANPVGAGVPEPSILWQKGFWTTSDATGAYTLPVLAGAYDTQAGQAAMFAYPGGLTTATVAGGATATANISLPSRVTQDASGHYQIHVEAEYFIAKPVDSFGAGYPASIIAFQQNAQASNQIALGYTDAGDFVDIPVDVPAGAGGTYTLTDYYFNGYWDGVSKPDGDVSFTANVGTGNESKTQDLQPNTSPTADPAGGYNTPGVKVFTQPITLVEGHNVIRLKLEAGSSNFDAFMLTSSAAFPARPSATRALRILAGLDPAPAPPSGAAFKALDVTLDNKIDMEDAVKLARSGQF